MNIDTLGITPTSTNENESGSSSSMSFAHDDVSQIKQKIESRKAKQRRLKNIFIGLTVVITLLVLAVVYSQYKLYRLAKDELTSSTAAGARESAASSQTTPKTPEDMVKQLGRHILVPQGTPQIAEVKDVEKLKETQAFFKDAQNDDIVFVYETMIYIYRPSTDIVIAVSDISGVGQAKP
jgi:hypothetical protein